MRFSLIFFVLLCVGCSEAGITPETAEAYHRHHPLSADGYYIMDSLTYPGNQPIDENGKLMPEPVRDWTYVNQDGDTVTNKDLLGQVYVVDFFFTSCPTICPTVKGNMLRIHEKFGHRDDFKMVSFTIDPKRDTPEAMKEYVTKLGVPNTEDWWYLHGDKLETYELDADYLSVAEENANAPGGFDHSGYIVLVDKKGFVRAYASGLQPEEVDHLMEDIELLL
ncbi:SCO family protein [Lewinellaceae bacterium SD302]|nr:SCO family protein [Lewinellaceae bacterium SD302]